MRVRESSVMVRGGLPGRRTRARALLFGLLAGGAGLALLAGVGRAATSADVSVPCRTAALVRAIDDANATPMTPTTLDLARRCPYLLTVVDNTSPFDGPNGLPVIVSHQLTINGHDAVIRRILTAPPFRILEVGPSGHLTLNDLTITGGDGSDGNNAGGILNRGNLAVTASQITRNTLISTTGGAAGVGITNAGTGTLTLSSVRITGNTGRGSFAFGGGLQNLGTATITDSVISSNSETASGLARGGGINNDGDMSLSDSQVTNNVLRGEDARGGGISNFFGTLTVIRSRVTGNRATAPVLALGGGIDTANKLMVQSSAIDFNTTTATGRGGIADGGGIATTSGALPGNATLEQTQVDGNAALCLGGGCAAQGGGVFNAGPLGHLSVDHSSVSTNTVTAIGAQGHAQGGGISNTITATILLQGDSHVANNTASAPLGMTDGGGIFNDASSHVVISDSVVENNKPNNCGGPGTPIAGCTG